MAGPLVATKLFVPRLRSGSVRRPRLSGRFQPMSGVRLILVSAPAGFGKSTLLAEWLTEAREVGQRVAWLSLDQSENDPNAFWSYVAASLAETAQVGGALLSSLQAGEAPDNNALTTLLNELGGLPEKVDIVLDDYHVIERPEIHAGLSFLLEHLPQNVRLIVSTRSDPALPLARLRGRGELAEIRAADLRFDPAEVAAYLNGAMDLGLTAANVADLGSRTEGWIAALQLAGLSLRGRPDKADFIAGFTGNDRYVFDYLVEEVLQRQPAELRRFLLGTSVLDRLSGPLCDAVLDTGGSGAVLEALHRRNLFVISLDDQRQWYRYHHLFAEVLQAHLVEETPDELAVLHRRASAWYEKGGEQTAAIGHAIAGRDFDRAASLIARAIPELRRRRREVVIRDWIRALPAGLVRSQPLLGVGLAGALLANGEFDGIDAHLNDAAKALAAGATPDDPHGELKRLPAQIAMYQAAMAQIRGDMPAMTIHAQAAADRSEGDEFGQAAAAGLLGIACWSEGDLERAERAWDNCFRGLDKTGHISDALGATVALADIAVTRGRLGRAFDVYARGLKLADRGDGSAPRGTADVYAGLGDLHCELGDLRMARDHLIKSRDLGERAGLGPYPYRWSIAMAGLLRAEGDQPRALEELAKAERVYVSDFFPNVRPIAAIIARSWIAEGRLGEAARWRRASAVGVEDDLSFLREFEHLTLARLLLAQPPPIRVGRAADPLTGFLARLDVAAERGGRMGSVIDIALLQALAEAARNEPGAAIASLERALTLAEPEGYVRLFVEAGAPMADLLRTAVRKGVAASYSRELLAAFAPSPVIQPEGGRLVEPLSERELDVLRLLRSDLDGPAIAQELMVSLNTMRTHTKSIYEKLGVNSRRAAVRRAEELNLLQRRAR